MPSIDSSIQWFKDREGNVTYSLTDRRGPSSYDCSSSVYYSLIQGGFFPIGIYIGNTESLFNDLEKNGFSQVPADGRGVINTQRGDVFIWGTRGATSGASGHTGLFEDANTIIHCSYGYNGIHEDNHDWLNSINGYPPLTVYRYTGTTSVQPSNPVDQIAEDGSYIKFDGIFTVDDLQDISDVWQVRTNALCPEGFTWADNGVPASQLIEVDNDGYATNDQDLSVGSKYKIPGKFKVLDVGQSGDRWLGKIQMAGLDTWVGLETATEVSADDPGTPTPINHPVVAPVPITATPVVVAAAEPLAPVAPETPTPIVTVTPEPTPTEPVKDLTPVIKSDNYGWLATVVKLVINWLKKWKKS